MRRVGVADGILTNNVWDLNLGYMHDRKASIPAETRFYHQGEAAVHADRWMKLSDQDAHALHTFLLSPRTFVDDVVDATR